MNFIQYIDNTYAVKIKEVPFIDEQGYTVKDIETSFFILSLYINNKRVNGVGFNNYDSLAMLSVINDMSNVDLNVIPENYFATAYTQIFLSVPYSSPSGSEILNFSDLYVHQFAYINKSVLPQYRHYNKFGTPSHGYSYDSRIFEMMRVSLLEGQNKFSVGAYDAHKNWFDLGNPKRLSDSLNDLPDCYPLNGFPVIDNGGLVQFGDFYVKISTISNYPYGKSLWLFKDVRTNEIWIMLSYIQLGTSNQLTTLFDLDTFKALAGGFEIQSVSHGLTVQISNIHG